MAQKKTKKESQLDIIARNVAGLKTDLTALATSVSDLTSYVKENMATKDDIHELERKLVEDTSVITGVEQKHHDSLAQRVVKLEKAVFHKTT